MRYAIDGMDSKITIVSCRNMVTALSLYLALHPNASYVIIRDPRADDKVADNIIYLDGDGDA